jgi:hypothetical protein
MSRIPSVTLNAHVPLVFGVPLAYSSPAAAFVR